jgi:hypothetical protein
MREILTKLVNVNQDAQVAMFINHRIVPIHEIVHVPDSPYVFFCEKARPAARRSYTESENGLIGYCAANGLDDSVAASLLGRTVEAIERQRKKLGF